MKENEHVIKDLVEVALRRMNFDSSITKTQVENAYRQVVGPFIVKLTWSVRYDVRTKTLKVSLASPALKRELSFKLTDLASAINEHVGSQAVQQIVLL